MLALKKEIYAIEVAVLEQPKEKRQMANITMPMIQSAHSVEAQFSHHRGIQITNE